MYKGIFDSKHAIYKIALNDNEKNRKVYNGEYEPDILCQNCDNIIIGQSENYANKIFYGGKFSKDEDISFYKEKQNDLLLYCVSGINYKKFKLFLLSILWRASISQRELFKFVSLGPYEEKIREMLINNDPGEEKEFPCIISKIPDEIPCGLISQPTRSRNKGTIYNFIINGFYYMYCISGDRFPSWGNEITVTRKNILKIPRMSDEIAKDMLNKCFNKNLF